MIFIPFKLKIMLSPRSGVKIKLKLRKIISNIFVSCAIKSTICCLYLRIQNKVGCWIVELFYNLRFYT